MTFPRKELAELVTSKVRGIECVWDDDAKPQVGASGRLQAWITLTMMGVDAHGQDEERVQKHPQNPDALLSTIVGRRHVTVTARARSFDREVQAYDLLEELRTGLGTAAAADFFRNTNTALVMTHNIAVHRSAVGGRTRLEATMDIVFARLALRVVEDDPGTTIDQVNRGGLIPIDS